MRRPSVHKRLERLEAAHKKQLNTPRHFALVRSVSFDGEGHIEVGAALAPGTKQR